MSLLNFFQHSKIPNLNHIPGPRGIEFIKLMLHFQKDSLGALEETYKRYGKIVAYPWPISTVIIYDPKWIKQVLIDKHQNYIKGTQTEKMEVVLGAGLVTNNDRSSWLVNRVIVSKEMNSRALRGFSSIIYTFSESLVSRWNELISKESFTVIDVSTAMRDITFSIAGRTLLGANLSLEDAQQVDAAVLFTSKKAHDHMFQLLPIPYWVPTPSNLIFHKHCRNLNRIVYGLIKQEKENFNKDHIPQSVIERLVHAKNPDTGHPLEDKTLRDEVLTLLIAGYETTSNTLTWILGLIAKHPEIQKKIQEELDKESILIDSIEFNKIYPILYYSIIEGIRLYTAIPMSSRKTLNPDNYDNYFIPGNTSVVIPVWVIHRHNDFWIDPLSFNPLRFLGVDINSLDNYIPFSKGGRRCVGENLAIVEVAIILQSILKKFDLKTEDANLPRPVAHVSLKPERNLRIIISRRD